MILRCKKIFLTVVILTIVVSIFFVGYFVGIKKQQQITLAQKLPINTEVGKPQNADFKIFWDVWNKINQKYVDGSGPSDQTKIYGAISGLVASLGDPYSVFFPPKESKYFNSEIRGNFEGVGMEVGMRDKTLTVIAPLKGTPAQRAGVRAGDKIIKIDGTITAGLSVDKSVDLIRGKKGTTVTLMVIRKDSEKPIEIKIIRDTINIPTIKTETRKDGIFVITLYSFTADSANLFRGAIKEFVKSRDSKLIIDLRNNPGGYMESAIDMASWFLPSGKIVVEEKTRDKKIKKYRSKGYNIFNKNLKVVILINQGSASAAEILSGALSEQGVATLVGTRSFGKGSVQELLPITSGTSLKITIAKWLTPKGISISKNGLTPDVKVEFTKKDFKAGKDPQLEKAVEILNKK